MTAIVLHGVVHAANVTTIATHRATTRSHTETSPPPSSDTSNGKDRTNDRRTEQMDVHVCRKRKCLPVRKDDQGVSSVWESSQSIPNQTAPIESLAPKIPWNVQHM